MKRGHVKKAVKPLPEPKFAPTPEYLESVRAQSYLGKKGYTVPKTVLTSSDLEFLKKDLLLKPEVHGITYGAPKDEGAFPVYRENDNKIYLPRFYGIERYGLPDTSEIEPGLDIDVPFVKELRDYQTMIVDKYTNFVSQPISRNSSQHAWGGILQVFTGAGKTVMAIKIISLLKKKTMILVHKEFLMNQWIERIQEYAPSARIGRIQAQIYDVDDKDIVIAMIQTMYNKPFPQATYSQFGLTIIDEVHRIGSEEFSKTLLKTITPYMLGISATVERKDKLTKLLHMFIGPMVYSTEKEARRPRVYRGIVFESTDAEFNETETDFRGKPKYSTMISKLCEFGPRKDFLVRILEDLREESPDAQIMILAHNRSLLTYLYEAIHHRGFATVGFYVGGMKQSQLKATEEQNIVLATYAMAAEALDIKTLSILVLATPKTDIVQSVGRILRMKHERPIVSRPGRFP
jgi:superfamily II DNA or RNA helicase